MTNRRVTVSPAAERLLSKLSRKTWMSRKDVISFAIYQLAKSEGMIPVAGPHQRRK